PPPPLAVPPPVGSARLARLEQRRNRVLGRLRRAEQRLAHARRAEAEYRDMAMAQQRQLQDRGESLSRLASLYDTYYFTPMLPCS
ncbi:hypothetical protein, partial [Hymenobacter cheonanensis]|uniref:hypothetical protein n=1 Tax=Hymenobacter sp. CA2-7 TaxID=3063993 RepID=UPI002713913F